MSLVEVRKQRAARSDEDRLLLRAAALEAVSACMPAECLKLDQCLASPPKGRTIVLGTGKAAGEMAAVFANAASYPVTGAVVTRHGHASVNEVAGIEVIEAGHPFPDDKSTYAAEKILSLANEATCDDRVIFLISGGGSALLSLPADGVSPAEKRELNRSLLHSGASIAEINTVRSSLSRVKAGRLAVAALPAELHTFIISDVVGDDPALIASGPSIAREIAPEAVLSILSKYSISVSPNLEVAIRNSAPPSAAEHDVHIIATADRALKAAEEHLSRNKWAVINLGSNCEGDASTLGREHAALARKWQERGCDIALISGGELTVEVRNANGCGGPNLEYLTGLMLGLEGAEGICALAIDSDGIDGSEDNAGGIIGPDSLRRAQEAGLDPSKCLGSNETYTVFEALGDLVVTGPTRTNVNDIRIILVRGKP